MTKKTSVEAPGDRVLRIAVPSELAVEIRRLAGIHRRSVQSVANAVLVDRFAGLTVEEIQRRWLGALSAEIHGTQAKLPLGDSTEGAES